MKPMSDYEYYKYLRGRLVKWGKLKDREAYQAGRELLDDLLYRNGGKPPRPVENKK